MEEEEKMRKRRQKSGVRSQNGTSDGTVERETAGFRSNALPGKDPLAPAFVPLYTTRFDQESSYGRPGHYP